MSIGHSPPSYPRSSTTRDCGPTVEDIDDELSPEVAKIASYKGRRYELRKEVMSSPERIQELEILTYLMLDTKMHLGFLWKVKKENSNNRIYLFGISHSSTVHEVYAHEFMHPKVYKKFKQCRELYVELNTLEFNSDEKNKTEEIEKMLEKTTYKTTELFLSKCIENIHKRNVSRSLSLDKVLMRLAHYEKMTIHSLETFEIQKNCVANTLVASAERKYDGEDELDIIDAIQSGNLEQLEELYNSFNSQYKQQLLDERNPNMATIISEKLINGEIGFFAIGVGHFIGEKGILSLLKDYKVKRIDLNPNDNTPAYFPLRLSSCSQ